MLSLRRARPGPGVPVNGDRPAAVAWLRGAGLAWRARRRRVAPVLLLAAGLAGMLAGGWLVGRWCLGVALIAESAGAVAWALNIDDGQAPPPPGTARTIDQILDAERMRR